jgi:A/G-specific adenine glycosylase
VATLAHASQDEVLHLWTGLGYYARGRNLHKAAQTIMHQHAGRFPADLDTLCELPGIGRSTGSAILAFAHDRHHAILDGNVKRVLTRYHAVDGWPGMREVETHLWKLAEQHTPVERVGDYTQAIMDLGATVCRRSQPLCGLCPLHGDCCARAQGNPGAYPARRPRKALPVKQVAMLMIRNMHGHVLLQQRPPAGVWGGLWGFPECLPQAEAGAWCRETLGLDIAPEPAWPSLKHTFSHFHLHITPIPARLTGTGGKIMEKQTMVWYNLAQPDERGLAAPVKGLLEQLRQRALPEETKQRITE